MEKMLLTVMSVEDKFIVLRAAEISKFKNVISVKDLGNGDIDVYTTYNGNHSPFWNQVDYIRKRSTVNRLRRRLFLARKRK